MRKNNRQIMYDYRDSNNRLILAQNNNQLVQAQNDNQLVQAQNNNQIVSSNNPIDPNNNIAIVNRNLEEPIFTLPEELTETPPNSSQPIPVDMPTYDDISNNPGIQKLMKEFKEHFGELNANFQAIQDKSFDNGVEFGDTMRKLFQGQEELLDQYAKNDLKIDELFKKLVESAKDRDKKIDDLEKTMNIDIKK